MQTLELQLFGLPQIRVGGEPVQGLLANKVCALLFYLAVNGQPYSREALALLFWPESPQAQGLRNLREVLYTARQWLRPYLTVTRHTLAFNQASDHQLDVQVFRQGIHQALAAGDYPTLQQVTERYRGEFLQGFMVRGAPAFDTWLAAQRHQLVELQAKALEALADHYGRQGDYPTGLACTQQLLTLEPWRESAHRQRMRLLASSGQRSAALAQYALCQQVLQAEYDAPPATETVALYARIRRDDLDRVTSERLAPPSISPARTQPSPADWVNWSALPNVGRFSGRRRELDQLSRWLTQAEQRMIALFGVGGQGKSALAAALVHELATHKAGDPALGVRRTGQGTQPRPGGRFARIVWRSLQEAPPLVELVNSWLQALVGLAGAPLPHYADAQIDYLLDVLGQQPCLLILDQVEALLQPGRRAGCYRPDCAAYADLFQRLVEHPHQSCLLLISREEPLDFARLANQATGLQMLTLTGLTRPESRALLLAQQVRAASETFDQLSGRIGGHPLALLQVAFLAHDYFGGELTALLQAQALIGDELRERLNQQFERLLPLEQALLTLLAQESRPLPLPAIAARQAKAFVPPPHEVGAVLDALRSLLRRGLVEQHSQGFSLPALLATYLMTCHPCASEVEPPAWAVKRWPVPEEQPLALRLPNQSGVSLIPA